MELKTIRFEVENGIGLLTINRPESFNGMTNLMLVETTSLLREVATRKDVRVLVLTGAGKSFCPGADLKHFDAGGQDLQTTAYDFQAPLLLHEMPQVTIAAINGACAGAGFTWACACDLRYAAAGAALNTAFLNVASAGDMGGPWTLPRLIGASKARELYFRPGKFSAEDAQRFGLVAEVFPGETLLAEVMGIAAELAARSPEALRMLKRNFLDAERMDFEGYLFLESERHRRVMAGPDPKEAFRAFLEKRPADFSRSSG